METQPAQQRKSRMNNKDKISNKNGYDQHMTKKSTTQTLRNINIKISTLYNFYHLTDTNDKNQTLGGKGQIREQLRYILAL